ncbi:MAG: prepilin-type N-terminal cleavage/methylation domain-containing protein [Lachnospiraceae bacterium]|nr:prepilin-type N-terminal cleavage/methylation domain-containing protein [Lachnospiraceae bacterium]
MKNRVKNSQRKHNDRGSTLIEMIVCFVLLSIFVASATVIISSVTNLFYQVKGQTYARQVSDIVMEKVTAEIEGAKWSDTAYGNPKITKCLSGSTDNEISLYDRTDTYVTMYRGEDQLLLEYAQISRPGYERESTIWKFDEGVYNQYYVEKLNFVPGDELISADLYGVDLSEYGLGDSIPVYDKNVVVVFLTVSSSKYGSYHTYRPVKMFNVPKDGSGS